jgi:hypothetical protein
VHLVLVLIGRPQKRREFLNSSNRALVGVGEALGLDHPDTLVVVQNLGLLHHERGRGDDAEKMWKRTLPGYGEALEPGHSYMLLVVQN